jgi:hypothetical protein
MILKLEHNVVYIEFFLKNLRDKKIIIPYLLNQ